VMVIDDIREDITLSRLLYSPHGAEPSLASFE
jgi:hypothetical protein